MKKEKNKQFKKIINLFLINHLGLLVFIIFFLITTLGFFFWILPTYKKEVAGISIASTRRETEYLERKEYLSQLETLKSEHQGISKEDFEKIKNILPTEEAHEELMAQLEVIIANNGLLLTSININEEGGSILSRSSSKIDEENKEAVSLEPLSASIKKIKINLNIVGTNYSGFKNILNVLENNLRLMDITSLNFDLGGESTSLEILTYYLEPELNNN